MLNKRIWYKYCKLLKYSVTLSNFSMHEYHTLQMEQKLLLIPRIILIFFIIPSILSAKTI